jgi:hypothetical protein
VDPVAAHEGGEACVCELTDRVFATPYGNTPCYGLKLSAMRVIPHFLLS